MTDEVPEAADGPDEPVARDNFEELRGDLQRSMLGKPAQYLTGALILVLVGVALLVGFTMLDKNGFAGASPAPTPGPSAAVVMPDG